jgi:hypothetical protein
MRQDAAFHVLRARLELDRTLRGRGFVGRAITGQLLPVAYAQFVDQVCDLLEATTPPPSLLAAGVRDLAALGRPILTGESSLVAALESLVCRVGHPELWGSALSALFGTSWTEAAIRGLKQRLRGNTAFLEELADAGTFAMGAIAGHESTTRAITALEITRGVVLGAFSHLEATAPRLSGKGHDL